MKFALYLLGRCDINDCWEWTGYVTPHGYGKTTPPSGSTLVHRQVYEALVGPVPDGLQLDHLCKNKRCCNPDHLEAVSSKTNSLRSNNACAINARRKTCIKGHELVQRKGYRACKDCNNRRNKEYHDRLRAKKRAPSSAQKHSSRG